MSSELCVYLCHVFVYKSAPYVFGYFMIHNSSGAVTRGSVLLWEHKCLNLQVHKGIHLLPCWLHVLYMYPIYDNLISVFSKWERYWNRNWALMSISLHPSLPYKPEAADMFWVDHATGRVLVSLLFKTSFLSCGK